MKTLTDLVNINSSADRVVLEIESYFKVQSRYFQNQTQSNLQALRNQSKKVKAKIKDYKELTKRK